jgi:hypothetical protein
LCVVIISTTPAAADNWRPVDPSELAQKTAKVEPGADAEAIFWDVKIEDSLQGQDLRLTLSHYIRIKIFTNLGKEKYATVEIEESKGRRIADVAGRTIRPDGSIVELKKDGIFDRELVKAKGAKVRGKTFTLPNVEVGDIIEYRYKEYRDNETANYMRLYYQRDLPIWRVTYHLKPLNLPWLPFGMRGMAFGFKMPPFVKEPDGYFGNTATDMPAFHEEPYMPPEDQLRAWELIYYEEDKKVDADKFWKDTGRNDYQNYKKEISPDSNVKKTAVELVSGIDKPEDKLYALDLFCRTKIQNVSSAASHLTAAQKSAIKENHSPGDILKQKAGRGMDVDYLFAALANAAGFDARLARVPDRGDTFFDRSLPTLYFLGNLDVAVKVNDKWLFFDPSTRFLENGMLRWQEEGQSALISDPKEGFFTKTQYLEPARSARQRRAALKLLDDGTLEGTVQLTYTGHIGREQKLDMEDKTAAQQEEEWKKSLQARLSSAEISDFTVEQAADPVKPLVVKYKVSVPGYGTRTGKRLLLQPAFFERNVAARFTDSKRKWNVYFEYPWSEDDDVSIELPDGWELDQPVAPNGNTIKDLSEYSVSVSKTGNGRKIQYRRKFDWGRNLNIMAPAPAYSTLKQVFDFVQQQDNFTLTLKAASDAH